MISFISDLDNTLIYSRASGGVCVEKIDEREISFMTSKAYELLHGLLLKKDFQFIPCTARSFVQTMRISFLKEHQPEYMICDLGASIYRNGVKDEDWEKYLLLQGIIYPSKMREIRGEIDRVIDLSLCRKIISNNDYFFVYCFHNSEDSKHFYIRVANCLKDECSFYLSGRKVYCCPKQLDKVLAVNYLRETVELGGIITSGDSMFDCKFNLLGNQLSNFAVLPGHAEFLDINHFYNVNNESGIVAGERILLDVNWLIKKLKCDFTEKTCKGGV